MADCVSARIAVIGGGKMGEAIVGGWIASDKGPARDIAASDIVVANPGQERRLFLEERYGVSCVADASQIDGAKLVVLAVKPQVMAQVLETVSSLESFGAASDPLFVSIAAGLPTSRLEAMLPDGARLVRVMPNMPSPSVRVQARSLPALAPPRRTWRWSSSCSPALAGRSSSKRSSWTRAAP